MSGSGFASHMRVTVALRALAAGKVQRMSAAIAGQGSTFLRNCWKVWRIW
jgi:hypothetical protein